MKEKNLRRIYAIVISQKAYNMEELRRICGYKSAGKVIDKLVREKMIEMKGDFKK